MTPLYSEWFDIPRLTADDIEIFKTISQYVVALIAFLLITLPATARAKVQSHIERSRLTQEVIQGFEAVYRQDGVVLLGTKKAVKEFDLLYVLNNWTKWRAKPPGDLPVPTFERGERYQLFVETSSTLADDARISIDHLHLVSGLFRRIGVGLDTHTLRRHDLNVMWNYIVVWTYANRLDYFTQVVGASRREFTRVIGSICRTYPIHVVEHPQPGRDFFDYLFIDDRHKQLTHIGWRSSLRVRYVYFFKKRRSLIARAAMKVLDAVMRTLHLF